MNNKKVFDFIGYRKVLFLIPIVIAVITVIFNCIFGIEMAIEFKGGTMLTYSYTGEIDTNAVKKTVEGENYGAVTVTTGSSMNSSLEVIEISFSSSEGLTADKQTALSDKLQQTFKDNSLTLVNSQDVNPTSGTEFFLKCLVAVLFSFILLVIYIAFRFKKIGGLSAGDLGKFKGKEVTEIWFMLCSCSAVSRSTQTLWRLFLPYSVTLSTIQSLYMTVSERTVTFTATRFHSRNLLI